MNSVDSVVDFFYNVVPGIIFLIILEFVYGLKLSSDAGEKVFLFIVLGLFLGFISQAVVKILREIFCFNDRYIFGPVRNDDKKTFDKVSKLLLDLEIIDKDEMISDTLGKRFHLMDNYLRSKPQSEIINHFASKAAFWSNIFIASLVLSIIGLSKIIPSEFDRIILIFIPLLSLLVSLFAATHYWRIQYDVVMKTFLAIYNIDGKLQKF